MNGRWLIALFVVFSGWTIAQESVPVVRFDSIPDPLKLPKDLYLGEVTGVAVNSKGRIYVLSRGNTSGPAYAAAATQLLEFDRNGKFIREIGKNLYAWSFGHSVRVDQNDNIWVTDKGSDMVIKFNPEGRVTMVFGRKQEASDEDTGPLKHPKPPLPPDVGRFRQVTDVTWDSQGNAYISDGYINSRIAKVDKNGNGSSRGVSRVTNLNTPHNIAADAQGNICRRPRQPANSSIRRRRQPVARNQDRRAGRPEHANGYGATRCRQARNPAVLTHPSARCAVGRCITPGQTKCYTRPMLPGPHL
jgi:hypothetical protein